MEIVLILIIILVLVAIGLEIYYIMLKKHSISKDIVNAENFENNKKEKVPKKKTKKVEKIERNDDFKFSQNDIDTFVYYLSPEDELGQYIAISIKPEYTLEQARNVLFDSKNLKEIISEKLKEGDIFIDEENSYLTERQIKKYMRSVSLNDELGQYIAAVLKEGESVSDISKKLFDSNHVKMIISNKLADLLNNIGHKRRKQTEVINDIDKYIESSLMKCIPKSVITENLLDAGYTLGDINSALHIIENNIKEGTSTKSSKNKSDKNPERIEQNKKKEEIKNYIKSRKTADGTYNYAKEMLVGAGHKKEHVESIIDEIKKEENKVEY